MYDIDTLSPVSKEGGGLSGAPGESIELLNLDKQQGRAKAEDHERRRRIKSGLKLRELHRKEAMKFSHSVQFNAVPDWSSNYISYSNLKKL